MLSCGGFLRGLTSLLACAGRGWASPCHPCQLPTASRAPHHSLLGAEPCPAPLSRCCPGRAAAHGCHRCAGRHGCATEGPLQLLWLSAAPLLGSNNLEWMDNALGSRAGGSYRELKYDWKYAESGLHDMQCSRTALLRARATHLWNNKDLDVLHHHCEG